MVVQRDETGRTYEARVPAQDLVNYIRDMNTELLAVIRLPNTPRRKDRRKE
jgi:hypothetical protein